VAGKSACAREIQVAFLADPERNPDGSCIADEPGPDFILPSEVMVAPGFYHSLEDINVGAPGGNPWLEAAVIVVLLVFILEIVFLLASGITRLFQREKGEAPDDNVARFAHPLAGLVAALGISIPVLMTDINQMLNNNHIMRYFGLPAEYWPVTILGLAAPLFLLLSAVLVVLTVCAWKNQHGSAINRVLLSLVALMAIVITIMNFRWGLVTLLI
jgi:hypothetical protein